MEQASNSLTPVTLNLISEPENKEASSELYHLLIHLTRGPALDKVINAGEYEGLHYFHYRVDPRPGCRPRGGPSGGTGGRLDRSLDGNGQYGASEGQKDMDQEVSPLDA